MKIRLIKIGIILFILLIIITVLRLLFSNTEYEPPRGIVIKTFKRNFEQFEYVKNILEKENAIIECTLLDDEVIFMKYDELTDSMVSYDIDNSELKQKISFILKNLEFIRINKNPDEVFFVYQGGYSSNSGIRYLITDNKDIHYIYENIKDRWYFTFFPMI
jgi:hypothetical protein